MIVTYIHVEVGKCFLITDHVIFSTELFFYPYKIVMFIHMRVTI